MAFLNFASLRLASVGTYGEDDAASPTAHEDSSSYQDFRRFFIDDPDHDDSRIQSDRQLPVQILDCDHEYNYAHCGDNVPTTSYLDNSILDQDDDDDDQDDDAAGVSDSTTLRPLDHLLRNLEHQPIDGHRLVDGQSAPTAASSAHRTNNTERWWVPTSTPSARPRWTEDVCTRYAIDRASLDRFLPMFNVATNIATRMQYHKFTFVLIFCPVKTEEDVSAADSAPRLLRLFAIRTFRDHDAELVRDLFAALNSRLLARLFGMKYDVASSTASSVTSTTNAAEMASHDDVNLFSTDDYGVSIPLGEAISFAFFRECNLASPQFRPCSRRIYFPSVFTYVCNTDAFLDELTDPPSSSSPSSSPSSSSNCTAPTPGPFHLLSAARDRLYAVSRNLFADTTNVERESQVLQKLASRLQLGKRSRDMAFEGEEDETSVDVGWVRPQKRFRAGTAISAGSAGSATESVDTTIRLHIKDSLGYWTKCFQRDQERQPTAVFVSADHCSTDDVVDEDDCCRNHDGVTDFSFLVEKCAQPYYPPDESLVRPIVDTSEPTEPSHQQQQQQQLHSLDDAHHFFLRNYVAARTACPEHENDQQLLRMARVAFHLIDPPLFDARRVTRDIGDLDAILAQTVVSLQLEFFVVRNKLNDVLRFVHLRAAEEAVEDEGSAGRARSGNRDRYRASQAQTTRLSELDFSRNFSTYYDYSDLFAAKSAIDAALSRVACLRDNRVLVPLEWLSNSLVCETLSSWSLHRLDFDVLPGAPVAGRPAFDFSALRPCRTMVSRGARCWTRYVRHMQRDTAELFDIDRPVELVVVAGSQRGVPQLSLINSLFFEPPATRGPDADVEVTATAAAVGTLASVLDQFVASAATRRGRDRSSSDWWRCRDANTPASRWIISLGDRFYGVKPRSVSSAETSSSDGTVVASRVVPREHVVLDFDSESLRRHSLIRVVLVEKMTRNVETCVLWSRSTRSDTHAVEAGGGSVRSRRSTVTGVAVAGLLSTFPDLPASPDHHNDVLDANDPSVATSTVESPFSSSSSPLVLSDPEPSIADLLHSFVRSTGDSSSDDAPCARPLFANSLEQVLFLDLLLHRSDPRFSVMVNGNPGTGKSTVMNFLTQAVNKDAFTLLPTNVLRERVSAALSKKVVASATDRALRVARRPIIVRRNDDDDDDDVCPAAAQPWSNEDDEDETMSTLATAKPTSVVDEYFLVDDHPVILTVSSFIKRVMRYNLGPDVYSKMIERYFEQQVARLRFTLRPMSMTRDLFPLERPLASVLYPPLMQVDEYNLCNYTDHFLVAKASEQMCVSRVYYGDFAQSSPIRGTNDNAELIALYAPLTVQFLDNKRLLLLGRQSNVVDTTRTSVSALSSSTGVDLHTLLADPVWNWKANNCDDGTNDYVRRIIGRDIVDPLHRNLRASDHVQQLRHSAEIRLDAAAVDLWFQRLVALQDWYDEQPCRRYLANRETLLEFARLHLPMLSLPCVISRRNLDSDRVNHWMSRCIGDYVNERCLRLLSEVGADDHSRIPSRTFANCFYQTVRRTALATGDGLERNCDQIHRHDADASADDEVAAGYPGRDRFSTSFCRRPPDGIDQAPIAAAGLTIEDDSWCSELTLLLGAVYRFIGAPTKFMCSDSLLRLVAFLPETNWSSADGSETGDQQHRPSSSRSQRRDPIAALAYRCDGATCRLDCENVRATSRRQRDMFHKVLAAATSTSPDLDDDTDDHRGGRSQQRATTARPQALTMGCGLPFVRQADIGCRRYDPRYPRLLMQRLSTRDDGFQSTAATSESATDGDQATSSFVVVSRGKFQLNRCNSRWTTNPYTNQPKREGLVLYGYPLVLNCGVSSWRVQGETIPRSDVYVDLKHMNKQQALVSLSRVRRNDQIRGVININLYGS